MIGAVVFTVVGMVVICTGLAVLVWRAERAHLRRLADIERGTADCLAAWAKQTGSPVISRLAADADLRARLCEKRLGKADG